MHTSPGFEAGQKVDLVSADKTALHANVGAVDGVLVGAMDGESEGPGVVGVPVGAGVTVHGSGTLQSYTLAADPVFEKIQMVSTHSSPYEEFDFDAEHV